jgi:hypothetical protein
VRLSPATGRPHGATPSFGLGILHRAKPHVVGGCDDKYPAGAERVGICRTALCVRGDWERTGNANGRRDSGDSVRPDLLHIWPNPKLTLIVNVLRSLWKPDSCFFSGVPAVKGLNFCATDSCGRHGKDRQRGSPIQVILTSRSGTTVLPQLWPKGHQQQQSDQSSWVCCAPALLPSHSHSPFATLIKRTENRLPLWVKEKLPSRSPCFSRKPYGGMMRVPNAM